jgi:hypothetical protein
MEKKPNKMYLMDETISSAATTLEQLLPDSRKKQIIKLANKRKLYFYNKTKQQNIQLFWDQEKAEMDALKDSHPFKKRLVDNHVWSQRFDAKYVLEFMDATGTREDYNTLCSWDPRELTFFLSHLSQEYDLPELSIYDLFYQDAKAYLSQFSKKYADKDAIKHTEKIKAALDTLFADVSQDEKYRIMQCVNLYLHGKETDFDLFHSILHKSL